jgi:hypothetical protein
MFYKWTISILSMPLIIGIHYILTKLYRLKINKKSIPGPIGIPVFGNIFSMLLCKNYMNYLYKNYGSIIQLSIFTKSFIILNDSKTIQEIFGKYNIIDRIPTYTDEHKGLTLRTLSTWKQYRKLWHKILGSYLNSNFLDIKIKKTLNEALFPVFNQYIEKNQLWVPAADMMFIGFNIIYTALFGHHLSTTNDKKWIQLHKNFEDEMHMAPLWLGLNIFGFQKLSAYFQNLAKDKYTLKTFQIILNCMYEYNMIDKNTYNPNMNINEINYENIKFIQTQTQSTVIDFFIYEQEKTRTEGKEEISNLDIIKEVYVMILAGAETTSKTLEYGLLLLAKYPNIQEQIYNELINHNYNNNNNILNMINQLHIFRAFIYELLRLSHVVPWALPHLSNQDVEITLNNHSYIIPKNTVILPNIQYANLNAETWNNNNIYSNELNLLNWLNNENKFKMNNNLMTFGTGKRNCVGQSIAIRTLYIVFSLIIIHYKINAPNNNINFEIKRKLGITFEVDPPIGLNLQKRNL